MFMLVLTDIPEGDSEKWLRHGRYYDSNHNKVNMPARLVLGQCEGTRAYTHALRFPERELEGTQPLADFLNFSS